MAVTDYPEYYVYKPCPTCGKEGMVYDRELHLQSIYIRENIHRICSEMKTEKYIVTIGGK